MTLFMVFRQFILRGEAIRLYRQMLRECRKIEHRPSREQLSRWIREEFENARHLKDEVHWPCSSGYIQTVCNIIHSLAKSFTVKSYALPYTGVCVSESITFTCISTCVFSACRPAFMCGCPTGGLHYNSCGAVWP